MSVANEIEALYEETLRMLDREAEIELGQIGRQFQWWLENHLPRMPYDGWRNDFDEFVGKLFREKVIVAEKSYWAWIERLREANEAAEEDARTMGSAEAVRAHMREYFKRPDPPQHPNDKPAPFDPDYPQLRRSGNAIMELYPSAEWADVAHLWLQSYRVPQEIKAAFVDWLEGERRDKIASATEELHGMNSALRSTELALAEPDGPPGTKAPDRGGAGGTAQRGGPSSPAASGPVAPASPPRPAVPVRRAAAKRFEYVPGAVKISIPRKPARDRYAAADGKLEAMFYFEWNNVPDQFVSRGIWRFPCVEVGVVQVAKTTSNLWRLDIDWSVDGGVPYPYPDGKNVIIDPFRVPPQRAWFEDSPNAPAFSMRNLGTIQRFRQDFEAHVVCLKGIEKGATYGGVRWWVQYVVRPGRPGGNASTDYTFSSDAQIINGPPSKDWRNQASRYFPTGG